MIRISSLLAALASALAVAGEARAHDPEGDWLASIPGPGGAVRLGVHIRKAADGALVGTGDSPDQNARGFALDEVTARGDDFGFVVPRAAARFRGKWDAVKGAYVGTFVQGPATIPITFAPGAAPPAPTVVGLDGRWLGQLGPLHLALRIRTDDGGTLGALDSPDQNAIGIAISGLNRTGQAMAFDVKAVGGRYEGVLAADGKSISGKWIQGGVVQPLDLAWAGPLPALPPPAPPRASSHALAAHGLLPDADVLQILRDRIDVDRQGVGMVVGLIDARGRRIIAFGHPDTGDPRVVDGDTVFEIGSISKVFTALLLADMARRGEVALADPAAKFLPPPAAVPQWQGRPITLTDLATHTSGLPRMPTNFAPRDPANPYADYTPERLYQFLGGYKLTRAEGARYEYSNLGGGLLGHVLSLRAGTTYEVLLQRRITGPLHMASTAVVFTARMKAHLAVGHDAKLKPVANWDLGVLQGAGAIRSTASDMLRFLAAELGYDRSPLRASMTAQLAVRRPTGTPGLRVALGWHVSASPRGEIVWHNGGTGGYRAFIGFNATTREGVVVLSNTSTLAGPDDIGFHLLDPERPLLVTPASDGPQ